MICVAGPVTAEAKHGVVGWYKLPVQLKGQAEPGTCTPGKLSPRRNQQAQLYGHKLHLVVPSSP